jgi:elongation factor G
MGELHLEILVDRLMREFNVKGKVSRPRVAYRETLTAEAEAEARFERQAGGTLQYALVKLAVRPLPAGEGFQFRSEIRPGKLPQEFAQAVREGCQESMESGILAGYPMVDVAVTLLGADWDQETSTAMAFKVAGSQAFRDAVERAEPVLLEPMMSLEVIVPEAFTGDAVGDLNARGASIRSIELRAGGLQALQASVPLIKMFGYATAIRSLTQGRGTFTMEFHHYAPVDADRMETIIFGGVW